MKYIIVLLLLLAGCATTPDLVWDDHQDEAVVAMRCVKSVLGIDPEFVEVKVHFVPDGTCGVNSLQSAYKWPHNRRGSQIQWGNESTDSIQGCYLVGDKVNIYVEDDVGHFDVPRVISHEMVHLILDIEGIHPSQHHAVTAQCGLGN